MLSASAFTASSSSSSPPSCTSRIISRLFDTSGDGIGESLSVFEFKRELLELIPKRPFGGPATNITTPKATRLEIEKMVGTLEKLAPLPPLANSSDTLETLDGDCQLVYSDASEITNIAKLLFGFRLGPVFQPIDVKGGRLENQALIKHLLFSGHTRVVADFDLCEMGETNAASVVNIGERANAKFRKVVFTLRRLLALPTFGRIRKTATPNGRSEQQNAIPSIDITYLDGTMRIARGGFGSLFVLTRPTGSHRRNKVMPMLLEAEAESISVDPESPTYDGSVDILPSGSRD